MLTKRARLLIIIAIAVIVSGFFWWPGVHTPFNPAPVEVVLLSMRRETPSDEVHRRQGYDAVRCTVRVTNRTRSPFTIRVQDIAATVGGYAMPYTAHAGVGSGFHSSGPAPWSVTLDPGASETARGTFLVHERETVRNLRYEKLRLIP